MQAASWNNINMKPLDTSMEQEKLFEAPLKDVSALLHQRHFSLISTLSSSEAVQNI